MRKNNFVYFQFLCPGGESVGLHNFPGLLRAADRLECHGVMRACVSWAKSAFGCISEGFSKFYVAAQCQQYPVFCEVGNR